MALLARVAEMAGTRQRALLSSGEDHRLALVLVRYARRPEDTRDVLLLDVPVKLYVDDMRPAPEGWLLATTVADAKVQLMRDDVEEVSLDHDMGACQPCRDAGKDIGDMETDETTFLHWCPHAEDGYKLAMWMCEQNRVPPIVRVHTMNPCGRKRMIQTFESFNRLKQRMAQ